MDERVRIEIPNIPEALAPANAQAEEWSEAHDVPPKVTYLLLLAMEELVTNCIAYGYDDADRHIISVELEIAAGVLSITVMDDGHAFNPLAMAAPDLTVEVAQRSIGGLGIHMLRQMSDTITYERVDGTNRVMLTKSIAS